MTDNKIHNEVADYYRKAANVRAAEPACDERWGAAKYDNDALNEVSLGTANLSMGCGNPFAMANLEAGETVLDLGSGGGLDVILSAKRVAPDGKAYGVDLLDEMIEVAQASATEAGVTNATFLKGMIEDVPLPDRSCDVVISNCVINLAPDKEPVFKEVTRVLRPGGRMAISDVVAENGYSSAANKDSWADCGAGALEHDVYVTMLEAAGLTDISIEFTHQTGPGLHSATVRANKPVE